MRRTPPYTVFDVLTVLVVIGIVAMFLTALARSTGWRLPGL